MRTNGNGKKPIEDPSLYHKSGSSLLPPPVSFLLNQHVVYQMIFSLHAKSFEFGQWSREFLVQEQGSSRMLTYADVCCRWGEEHTTTVVCDLHERVPATPVSISLSIPSDTISRNDANESKVSAGSICPAPPLLLWTYQKGPTHNTQFPFM